MNSFKATEAVFHYNTDLSGDVIIGKGEHVLNVSLSDMEAFVNHAKKLKLQQDLEKGIDALATDAVEIFNELKAEGEKVLTEFPVAFKKLLSDILTPKK